MNRNGFRTAVLALALLCGLPAGADYEAGRQAWGAGRPAEALAQWRAAADGGDRRAMLALGRLYAQGMGAPQDYLEAHMWFNLAASRGEMAAVEERDALAAKMTPQQVQAAQALARSWRPGGGAVAGAGTAGTAGGTGATTTARAAPDAGVPPPRAIREAQRLLAGLGYAPGPADGKWGGRTALAYRLFLEAAGLPPAERLTPEALRAMRAIARGEPPGRAAPAASEPEAPRASTGAAAAPPASAFPPDVLHRAAQAGNIAVLEAALAAGAAVDARDGRGWTALMYAVNKGYPLLMEPLLEAGADPDVRAPDGATALFMAAVHGHTEVIELLMEAGADPKVKGPKGKTAADAARTRYGEAEAAKENGEPPAVIVLLEGRTLAEEEEEDDAFARAQAAGTVAAYEEYLSSHPEGRHAEEARQMRQMKTQLEENRRRAEEAKSLDTLQAYEGYLSSYCPQGSFCGAASTRRDELLREAISASIFRGSLDDDFYVRLTLRFIPTGELIGHYDARSWAYGVAKVLGTWNVEKGEVRMSVKDGGIFSSKRAFGMATLSSDTLAGYFDWTTVKRFWRLEKIKDPDRLRVEDTLKPNASSPPKNDWGPDGK